MAPVGESICNLCLVGTGSSIEALKRRAIEEFQIPPDQPWRSITPLTRPPITSSHDGLLLIGDAARVVEPFTGEGILYALASAELASRHIVQNNLRSYASTHSELYRGRLWLNHLARFACMNPRLGSAMIDVSRRWPALLEFLTRRVVAPRTPWKTEP